MNFLRPRLRAITIVVALVIAIFFLKKTADILFAVSETPQIAESPGVSSSRAGKAAADRRYSPAPGAPIEGSTSDQATIGRSSYTNEDLHVFLEQEQRKMGIKKIDRIPREEIALRQEMTREWMSQMREQIGRTLETKETPSVKLEGDKPSLLTDAGSNQASGSPEGALAGRQSSSSSEDAVRAGSPLPSPPAERSAHSKVAPLRPGGYIVRSRNELETIWSRASINATIPVVDFDRNILILVYGGNDAFVEMGEPQESGGRLEVRYRTLKRAPAADQDMANANLPSSFQYRILTHTDLPIEFQQQP